MTIFQKLKEFLFEGTPSNYNEISSHSKFLKESIKEIEFILENKELIKSIQQLIMLTQKIRLSILEKSVEAKETMIFFLIMILCNNNYLIPKFLLMQDYLEFNKERSTNEKYVLSAWNVNFFLLTINFINSMPFLLISWFKSYIYFGHYSNLYYFLKNFSKFFIQNIANFFVIYFGFASSFLNS